MSEPLHEEGGEHENTERWLITYADMITLLMAFFIMMYAMSKVDQAKFAAMATSVRAEFAGSSLPSGPDVALLNQGLATSMGIVNGTRFGNKEAAALRENVEKGLDKALGRKGLRKQVQVLQKDGNLIIRLRDAAGALDDRVLFASGSAQLPPKSRELLSRIATILRLLPYAIRIEGHTDNLPIHTALFPSNWELSMQRATNVVLYLVREEGMSPERVGAAGYADTKPVAPNDTPAHRQENRRIDMVVFVGRSAHDAEGKAGAGEDGAVVLPPVERRLLDDAIQRGIVPPINIIAEP